MWTHYHTVASVDEALDLLATYGERARIVAGGTDLLIELERGTRRGIHVLIDLSRAAGLDSITDDGDMLRIGANVTHNQIAANPFVRNYAAPLAQASWAVGAPQIRNRATLAGNVITASPANDTITPLMALGASVELTSRAGGRRLVPLNTFYTGVRRTVMRPDELLRAIHVPKLRGDERGLFLKLGLRRAQAIAVVNCAVVLSMDGDVVREARLTLGCVAPTIIALPEVGAFLSGKPLSEAVIHEAARQAAHTPTPISDVRATADYRREMVGVCVARALRTLREGGAGSTPPADPVMLWGARGGKTASTDSALHERDTPITTTINGQPYTLRGGNHKTLLRLLREDAHLPGTKEGCAEGECGACTVFLDGAAVMACLVPAPRAHHAQIVTVEGLSVENGQGGKTLHPLQASFIDQGAVQCGYCTPGFLMAGAKLLEEHPHPTRAQIEESITGNLCRCTGYYSIVAAIAKAAAQ
ncbi:MAG TPA: FAD binding domain-containing protein, partial [Aggregatilineales bacterium]|nr:FAD binding domain-containing protein [Anaerolineales bacterium]HRE49723.1 FAD binding domain-containing protein [Aggregatilineales bacterium]